VSFFGRLFGSSAPPPNTVAIAADLVAGLTAGGVPLEAAVDAALRRSLEAERRAAEAEKRGEKIPFWLRREGGGSAEMEDALRDRIAQRRASEDDR
jgi:hypothetical protein